MIEFTVMSRPRSRSIAFSLLLLLVLALGACSNQNTNPEQLIASAKQEREKGHYRNAIIHLKSALEQSPQNAEARYLLGLTYTDTGDFKSAESDLRKAMDLRYDMARVRVGKPLLMMDEFQKVLDQVPLDANLGDAAQAEILTLRGLASIGLGRHQEGRELLAQALAKQPEFADALVAQAFLALRERKPAEASQLIERAIASAPKNIEAWTLKGDLARTDSPAGALAAYQKVLEISPEYTPAYLRIAEIQIGTGSLDDARKHLEQVNKIAPNLPVTKYLTALIEFRQKKYTAARETVLQALKVGPDHLPTMLLAATVEHKLGEYAQAQAHLAQVLERAPNSLFARKLLVASLANSGQMQRAIEVLQSSLKKAPEDGDLLQIAGEVYLHNNEFARAAQYFEKAAKLDPKSAAARTGLGRTRLASGETDQGLADLEAAIQLDSEDYQAEILLVTALLQRNRLDQALPALQALEKKQPKNPLTYNLKAAVHHGKQDYAAERKDLEHALGLNPTYVPAAINLAELDLRDKKPADARRRLEAILGKDKDNTDALTALALLAPRIGATPKEVIDWLERARKTSPGAVRPQVMLIAAFTQSGDTNKALEVAKQAQTANPDSPEILDALGTSQILAGEKERGLATYNRLVALEPKSAAALLKLAAAQSATGDQAGAAKTLRKAQSLQPDFVDAHAALAALEVNAGRYPAALKVAQQLQKQSAKSPAGFILEGNILMAERKFLQAAKAYEIAYGMSKTGAVLIRLHAALTRAGKPEEAEGRLAQALKESPDDADMRKYVAEASFKSGKYRTAIEQYEWLVKKHPDDELVLNNLALVYQQVKDARALEAAERAYQLMPGNGAVGDTLGWMLVEQGNTKRGLELLEKAVTAEPKVPENRYHLAQALLKAGNRAKARQELEKIIADFPNATFEQDARKLLQDLR